MRHEGERNDQDLLEAYLDGALTFEEAEALNRQLGADAGLAAELECVRAARAVRRAVWASYEPEPSEAEALAAASIATAARQDRLHRAARLAGRATAAAAAIVLAFAGGWVARGRLPADGGMVAQPVSTDDHAFVSSGAGDGPSFPVALTVANGNVIAVRHFDDTLGVTVTRIETEPLARGGGDAPPRPALRVDQVIPDSAAHHAGVRVGDVIMSLAGEPVADVPALSAAVAARDGPTKIQLRREGKQVEVTVELVPK